MAFPGKKSVARWEICGNFFKFNLQILDKLWLKSSSASKKINVLKRGNYLAGRRSSFRWKWGKIAKFRGPFWKDVQFPSTRKHKIPLYMHAIKVANAIAVQCWLLWSNLLFSCIYILFPFNLSLWNKISVFFFLAKIDFYINEIVHVAKAFSSVRPQTVRTQDSVENVCLT